MTGFVKGFEKPEMNKVQQDLLDMFVKESAENEASYEPVRIDKVLIDDDEAILIYTSRFIQVEYPQRSSMQRVRHLQILAVHRMWNEGEDEFDPYGDLVDNVGYREVLMTNVFRTFEGDEGWNTGYGKYEPDTSDLNLWA